MYNIYAHAYTHTRTHAHMHTHTYIIIVRACMYACAYNVITMRSFI